MVSIPPLPLLEKWQHPIFDLTATASHKSALNRNIHSPLTLCQNIKLNRKFPLSCIAILPCIIYYGAHSANTANPWSDHVGCTTCNFIEDNFAITFGIVHLKGTLTPLIKLHAYIILCISWNKVDHFGQTVDPIASKITSSFQWVQSRLHRTKHKRDMSLFVAQALPPAFGMAC